MDYKLITNKDGATYEIKHFGDLEWSDDLDCFTTQMSFKSPEIITIGAQIGLINEGKEIFRGIVFDREWERDKIYSYMVFDYAQYLGKNELIIQFNGCTISEAIKNVLIKLNAPEIIGNIVEIPAHVKKIYKKVLASDIIKDLLKLAKMKTGIDYILRMNGTKINIEKFIKLEVSPTYDNSGTLINITENVGNFHAVDSIIDMRNKVVINDNSESSIATLAQAESLGSEAKYGTMSVVETPDSDDKTPKQVMADNLLKKLNVIKHYRSVDMLGSDEIKKGVLLSFNYPEYGFVGQHLVTSTKHNVDNGIHKVSVELESYDEPIL